MAKNPEEIDLSTTPRSSRSDDIDNPISWEPSAAFFRSANLTLLACAIFFLLAVRIFVPEQTERYIGPSLAGLLAITGWSLSALGYMRAAVTILVMGSWIIVAGISLFFGGVHAPIAVAFPLVGVLAGWLVSRRMAILVTVLTVLTVIGFALAMHYGVLPPTPRSPLIMYVVSQSFMAIFACVLIYYLVRSYHNRLRELNMAKQGIEEREALQSLMLSSIHAGVMIIDPEMQVIERANKAAAELFGRLPEEIVGQPCHAYICEQHDGKCPLGQGGEAQNVEGVIRRADGTRRTVLKSVVRISLQGREKLLESFFDITGRKEAEDAKHEAQAILQSALDQSPVGISIAGADTFVRYVNRAGLIIRGEDPNQADVVQGFNTYLAKRPQLDLDGRPLSLDEIPLSRAVLRGEASSRVFMIRRPDGADRIVSASAAPIRNQMGEIIAGIAVFDDITERKAAEEKLQETQAILQAAMDQSPAGIAIGDVPDGAIRYINKAGLDIRGPDYDDEAVFAAQGALYNHRALLDPDGTPLQREDVPIFRAVRYGETGSRELVICRADHQKRFVESHAAPIRNAVGEVVAAITVFQDITDRKKAEEELEQHRHHLEEIVAARTAELEQSRDAAQAASLAKSSFLANMSHEIRTPMNAILGLTKIMQRGELPPEHEAHLDKIDSAGQHLLRIISDVLDISKIEAGKLTMEAMPLDIGELLYKTCVIMQERAQAKGLSLRVDLSDCPKHFYGDPTRLQQALLNYVGNAVKFSEQGDIVLRALAQEAGDDHVLVRFEVEDGGAGIRPEELPRLFSAFEQVDNSDTRKYGGTGLGLAITRRLAELMGGDAGVRSIVGVGSIFWFTARLRQRQPEADVQLTAASPAECERAIRAGFAGTAVLAVDDDEMNLEVIRLFLGATGLDIDIAEDGVHAVEQAGKKQYALILMDMQMPNMDGLEAARRIRQMGEYAEVPIIAVTANAFVEDKMRCHEAGMDEFLIKPFDPDALLSIVLKFLSRGLS